MARYKDPISGDVIEVGNPAINPDLIKGRTLVSDTTPLGIPQKEEPTGIVTSGAVKKDIAERGQEPMKTDFASEADYEEWKARVEPVGGAPTRPSAENEYTALQKEYGTATLDEDINKNIEEQDKLIAGLEAFKTKETGGESQAFYAGRISEEEGYTQTRLTLLQNREKILRNRLDTKNKTIDAIMKLKETDYDNARKEYEFEYNKNVALTNAYASEKDKELTADKSAYNTIYNMYINSGKPISEVPDAIIQQMNQFEIKMGMPVGTFAALATAKPKANIIQSGVSADASGNEFAWMISQEPDGIPSLTRISTGGYKKTTTTNEARQDLVTDYLSQRKGEDQKVSAQTYQDALKKWIAEGGTQTNFFSSFPRETWLTEQEAKNLPTELKTTEQKKTQGMKDIDISTFVEALNKSISGGKITRAQIEAMINSGKITNKGVTYDLTPEQQKKLLDGIKSTKAKLWEGLKEGVIKSLIPGRPLIGI